MNKIGYILQRSVVLEGIDGVEFGGTDTVIGLNGSGEYFVSLERDHTSTSPTELFPSERAVVFDRKYKAKKAIEKLLTRVGGNPRNRVDDWEIVRVEEYDEGKYEYTK